MAQANYWFEPSEYHGRVARVQAELRAKGLDALIAFQPESVTWLTGFFTRAYSSFQFAIIPANGAPTMFCRDVESCARSIACSGESASTSAYAVASTCPITVYRAITRLLGWPHRGGGRLLTRRSPR